MGRNAPYNSFRACLLRLSPSRLNARVLIGSTDSMVIEGVATYCPSELFGYRGRRLIGLSLRVWTSHLIVFQSLLVPSHKEQPGSVQTCGVRMFLQSLLVLSQRVARLVSNVRASTRTAHSVTVSSVWCGRSGEHKRPTGQILIPFASTRTDRLIPHIPLPGRRTNRPPPFDPFSSVYFVLRYPLR